MGVQHALAGTATWLAATPALDAAYGLTPGQVALGAFVTAGGAMVPDLDMPGSTIGRTYGPVTNVIARAVAFLAGGHRRGTHSLLGVAALTLAAAVADTGWPRFVLLWIVLGVACRAYGIAFPGPRFLTSITHAVTMGGLTFYTLASGMDLSVVLVAGVGLGALSHLVTDMLTPGGCPLLWPLSGTRYGVPVVTTGNRWSSPLVTTVLAVAVLLLAVAVSPYGLVDLVPTST